MPLPNLGGIGAGLTIFELLNTIYGLIIGDDGIKDRVIDIQTRLSHLMIEFNRDISTSYVAVAEARSAVILADTQALTEVHVPEILAAIDAIEGGGGGGGLTLADIVSTNTINGGSITLGTALSRLYRWGEQASLWGYVPFWNNPQFAYQYMVEGAYSADTLFWLTALNPKSRPAGETVLDYLNRVDSAHDWSYDEGPLPKTWIAVQGVQSQVGVVCLVHDGDRAAAAGGGTTGEYDARLAAIKQDTEAIISDVAAVHAEANEIDAGIDQLLIRTGNTEAADVEILGPMRDRLRTYLTMAGEGTIGGPIAIAAEGTMPLDAGTAFVLIEMLSTPPAWQTQGSIIRYYDALAYVAFGCNGRWAQGTPLYRLNNWLAVPPGATDLLWSLVPGVTGQLRLGTVPLA